MEHDDDLILVDEHDAIVGYASRAECHAGKGRLHRAFSAYVFDDDDRLILQRRSARKSLWPGYWSNTCCSHPRRGEDPRAAAESRLRAELGIASSLTLAFKYHYRADFMDAGAEDELCLVFLGRRSGEVRPHADEVDAWRLETIADVTRLLRESPQDWTPWFRIAWPRICAEHLHLLATL